MTLRTVVIAAWMTIGAASAAAAQSTDGRIEVAAGVGWFGGLSMASVDATQTQANNTPRTLFGFSRELTSTAAIQARVAVRLSAHLDVEATGTYARPKLRVTTANDVEGAAAVTATEQLQEFTVGGAASWFLIQRDAQTRTRPYVAAGISFARQLHEGNTLAESGGLVDMGGGVEQVLTTRAARVKSTGLRFDARARVRPTVLAVDGRTHVSPVAGASLFVRF